MRELSVLIPSRNEMFLKNTVEDLLKNMRGDTEILVGLDGQWPVEPIEDHKRVTLLYYPESIGQRGITNKLARMSRAKYVMKCDAHCAFDEGFDVKMMADMQPDWTMVPLMKNLHAFDWVCKECGHRRYQGPTKPCPKCESDMKREIIWKGKPSPNTTSMMFNPNLKFKYWGGYKKRQKGDLVETMSILGACWMLTRDKYFELEICDEKHGGWGQQGTEVSAKTQLSGGKLVCNKKTWFAHMFRTQGGDFSFPYRIRRSEVNKARRYSRELFLNNKWEKQIYPLSWLVKKYWPVQSWKDEDLAEQKRKEMEVDRPGIYSIRNHENGKVYIGSAISLSQRFSEHLRMLKRTDHDNPHLQNSWNKHGEDAYSFNIEMFCSIDDLVETEQGFLDKLKDEIGWNQMYNISPTAGSQLGLEHTAESRAKMSTEQSGERNGLYGKKHSEESIEKMRKSHKGQVPWNKGIPHSEETKRKISEAKKGKPLSDEHRAKLSVVGMGRVISEETKEKLKKSPRFSGHKHTEESKKKIGASLRKTMANRKRDNSGKFIRQATKGIVYYTTNKLNMKLARACRKHIAKARLPIVSVSLKKMDKFGKNIHLPLKPGPLTMFKQILAGLEASDAEVVFFCEHDVLYHPSHFDFVPPEKDRFYYNTNVWKVRREDGHAVRVDDCRQTSGLCAYRELLLEHYRKRVEMVESDGFTRRMGFEPGTHNRAERVDDYKSSTWESEHPIIDIRHSGTMTPTRWKPEQFRNKKFTKGWREREADDELEGWGKIADTIESIT